MSNITSINGRDYIKVERGLDVENNDPQGLFQDDFEKFKYTNLSPNAENINTVTDYKVKNDDGDELSSSSEDEDNIRTIQGSLLTDEDFEDDGDYFENEAFSGAFRWKYKNRRWRESQELINAAYSWGLIMCAIYIAAYTYFLYAVLFQIPWKHGMYGNPLPHQNAFVSDHFGVIWSMGVLTLCNLFVPAILLWILSDLESFFRRELGLFVVVSQAFVGLFVLVVLCVLLLGFCNTGVFRNPVCDDPNIYSYCTRWANSEPSGCPQNVVQNDNIVLAVNQIQYRWLAVLVIFIVLDGLIAYTIWKMNRLIYWGHIRLGPYYGRYVEDTSTLYPIYNK